MKKLLFAIVLALTASASSAQSGKQKPATDSIFVLAGKLQDFQLLYRAVESPGDVTPNQSKAILDWIKGIRLIPVSDTTKRKKP